MKKKDIAIVIGNHRKRADAIWAGKCVLCDEEVYFYGSNAVGKDERYIHEEVEKQFRKKVMGWDCVEALIQEVGDVVVQAKRETKN